MVALQEAHICGCGNRVKFAVTGRAGGCEYCLQPYVPGNRPSDYVYVQAGELVENYNETIIGEDGEIHTYQRQRAIPRQKMVRVISNGHDDGLTSEQRLTRHLQSMLYEYRCNSDPWCGSRHFDILGQAPKSCPGGTVITEVDENAESVDAWRVMCKGTLTLLVQYGCRHGAEYGPIDDPPRCETCHRPKPLTADYELIVKAHRHGAVRVDPLRAAEEVTSRPIVEPMGPKGKKPWQELQAQKLSDEYVAATKAEAYRKKLLQEARDQRAKELVELQATRDIKAVEEDMPPGKGPK